MAKYIDREKLPQFQFYNHCNDEHGWIIGEGTGTHVWKSADPDDKTIDYRFDVSEDEFDINEMDKDMKGLLNESLSIEDIKRKYIDCMQEDNSFIDQIMQRISFLLKVMYKDDFYASQWEKRIVMHLNDLWQRTTEDIDKNKLTYALAMLDEVFSFAIRLKITQGYPLYFSDGDVALPKLLLIEDKIYQKIKGSADITIDYEILRSHLQDCCYIININGETAEKKMVFLLNLAGESIDICMLDPKNGLSEFVVNDPESELALTQIEDYNDTNENGFIKDGEGAVIGANIWHCHPRGEYGCQGSDDYEFCTYCNGKHTCSHRSMDIISAVLYCTQEYFKKLDTENKLPAHKKSLQNTKNKNTPFIPKGMVRLYDIKINKEELVRINKFMSYNGGSGYASTEKCPHTRRGTMRYNPKTGKKDIKVKGSIIHKDKYEGFSSAERVVE